MYSAQCLPNGKYTQCSQRRKFQSLSRHFWVRQSDIQDWRNYMWKDMGVIEKLRRAAYINFCFCFVLIKYSEIFKYWIFSSDTAVEEAIWHSININSAINKWMCELVLFPITLFVAKIVFKRLYYFTLCYTTYYKNLFLPKEKCCILYIIVSHHLQDKSNDS